jgi:hypothetical protein
MYAPSQFRPVAHGAFLPQVRLAGMPRQQGLQYGQAPFLGTVRLSQGPSALAEEYYKRARASLERYRFLKNQIQTIDNKVGRDSIVTWLGSPNVVDSPEYRYARVLQDFTYDAAPAQEGIAAYDESRRRNRVDKLEDFNDELNQKIESARVTYGSRPAPTVPGKNGNGNGKPEPGPDLTIPIIAAGAAVALAVIFG